MNQTEVFNWIARALIAVCIWLFLDVRSDVKDIKAKLEQTITDVAVLKSEYDNLKSHRTYNPMPFDKPKPFKAFATDEKI
jgi:hypothetical protein